MFAKVFAQIFDSSISEDYIVRHVFMDLLVLADREGIVDMTLTAISRRTNVPPEVIQNAINKLLLPDPTSRSDSHQGCRIAPLDNHRDWGWYIVNFSKYRDMRDEEARKSYFREYQRTRRAKDKAVKDRVLTSVYKSDKVELLNDVTHVEVEVNSDAKAKNKARATRLPQTFSPSESHQEIALERRLSLSGEFAAFRDYFTAAPGQKGLKLDWDATFRNWLRNSRNGGSNGQVQNGNGRYLSKGERGQQAYEQVVAEILAEDRGSSEAGGNDARRGNGGGIAPGLLQALGAGKS